jgi:hypothetical protein
MLDELAGWKRVYADDLAIVHFRDTAPWRHQPTFRSRSGSARSLPAPRSTSSSSLRRRRWWSTTRTRACSATPYAFALNYFYDAQFEDDVIAFLVITAGGGAIVLLSLLCRGRERFLPRYAFYAFYPGHLLLLALIRAIWVSGAAP